MTLDDGSLVEVERKARSEGRVLRGAVAHETLAAVAYGSSVSDLVAAACREDEESAAEAFVQLMNRFQPRVFGICYWYFPNIDEASDMARSVWSKIIRARADLDPSKDFGAYLKRAAENYCIDRKRTEGRRGPLGWGRVESLDAAVATAESEGEPLVDLVADPATFDSHLRLQLKEVVDRVLMGLSMRLSVVHRYALWMYCVEGYTYTEIRERLVLSCTDRTVKNVVDSAKKDFAFHFSQEWEASLV